MNAPEQVKIVILGHVDHGKSTLVGRLFHDTGSLPEGRLEQLQQAAQRRGFPFEWANLMDALQAERDQNISIDTAQIWFRTAKRRYVIDNMFGSVKITLPQVRIADGLYEMRGLKPDGYRAERQHRLLRFHVNGRFFPVC